MQKTQFPSLGLRSLAGCSARGPITAYRVNTFLLMKHIYVCKWEKQWKCAKTKELIWFIRELIKLISLGS